MSENLNGLFNETSKDAAYSSARSLAGTAQLTTMATEIAGSILKKAEADFENYKDMIAASKADHSAMDKFINSAYDVTAVDVQFLKELDEDTIDNMLKSQQSKRSRAKGRTMTMDNYKNMLVGAIAEQLIRFATGKEKSAVGARRQAGAVEFTAEELEALKNDQQRLRKEIRNIQSKKSIFRSKPEYSETDPHWLKLLEAETQLKNIRTGEHFDETKSKLGELLGTVDLNNLKATDAKKLIEQALALVKPNEEV